MQATEKKTNKIWLAVLSVGVVIALILGIVALVNHGDTKANAIPTINQQVDNIKNTLPELEKVSTELKGYIDTLETTTEKLQSDLTATNTAIDALETEVYGKIDAEKTATLNQLKADKTELENKLAAANKGIKANDDAITALEATAAKLQKELDDNAEVDAATKADLEADIAAINAAIEALKSKDTSIDEKIAALETADKTTSEKITAIGVSIDDLKEVDKEIDGYIKSLQTTAANLQSQLDAANEKIDSVKKDLSDEIDDLEKNLLNELNNLETDIEGQLATINNAIVALQAKDDELDQKIANLQTYVDYELANYATTDWATATFATLQMYQQTQETIAGIELNIRNINDELKALETRMGEKIANEIKAAVDALRTELKDDYTAKIKAAVEDITSDYNAAIQTARNEIEAAYKAAIETAVATLKTDMQNWVNEQLEKPLQEIAALQANLSALTNAAATDEELKTAVAAQENALKEAVDNLTAAYKKAITDAIAENNGVIGEAISNAITTATNNLNSEINIINSEITSIKSRLDELENIFAKRIQSLTFIPQYSDGKILMDYNSHSTKAHFRISPAEIAEVITVDNVKVFARYTDDPISRTSTRASYKPEFPLVVRSVSGDNTGMLELDITESSENELLKNFWMGEVEAVIYIEITDKNGNNVVSEAIPMVAHNYVNANFSINDFAQGGTYDYNVRE